MIDLLGKSVIVTGGARGIGLSIAAAITDAGGCVAILDLLPTPPPACQQLINASDSCDYFSGDITDPDSLASAFTSCVDALGGSIEGIVTCAGIGTDKPFLDHTPQDLERVTKVNQYGTFFPVQLAVRQMLAQPLNADTKSRGSIVMIASQAAGNHCPGHFLTAYGGTKGFVKSFSLQLSHELATSGIRCNSVSPGYIDTDLNRDLARRRPEASYYFREAPPMKRLGQPHDVAGGAVYLLSDLAAYVTGIDLRIDGGMGVGNGLTQ